MKLRPRPLLWPLALAVAVPAAGEPNPWYLGASQTLTHDSNVYRLADGAAAPPGVSKSDLISSTAVMAGVDQPIGRQRLQASAVVRANRFQDNGALDNNGYALRLRMDLSTAGRVSGEVDLSANRSLATFNTDTELGVQTSQNIESSQRAALVLRMGVVTAVTAEAGVEHRRVDYSAPEYDGRENHQTTLTAGLRYRPSSDTVIGVGVRHTQGEFPRFQSLGGGQFLADRYRRNGLDLLYGVQLTGASRVDALVTIGRTSYDQATQRDFSGVTGSLAWDWRPGGRLGINTVLSRDTGLDSYFSAIEFLDGYTNYSRTTTALRVRADYALTAKVRLNAGLGFAHRELVRTLPASAGLPADAEGRDDTTSLSLGARWEASRNVVAGCDLAQAWRRSDRVLSLPFQYTSVGCYGQVFLR